MPSTYTANLRLTLPADGELVGTWGQVVNNGVTALIEAAISGRLVKALPDADYTLTTANGATDEARNAALNFTGVLTATRNVICPAVSKSYLITNSTNQSIVFKTLAGTGVTIPAGARMAVACDGTNVVDAITRINANVVGNLTGTADNANNLGGVPAANYATTAALGNYVLKAGDTMTGALVNTSTVKIGNGVASNSARLMINTLSGTAAGVQLFQDGVESWVMESVPSDTGLRWTASGTERMRITSAGNVGIGTTPSQRLDVLAPGIISARFRSAGASNAIFIEDSSTTPGSLYLSSVGSALQFVTGSAERMRIDGSGRILIGTSSGGDRLVVSSSVTGGVTVETSAGAAPTITFAQSATANWTLRNIAGSGSFAIRDAVASSDRMVFDASGNVGIGTTPVPVFGSRRVLHIDGSATSGVDLRLTGNGGSASYTSVGGALYLGAIADTPANSFISFANGASTFATAIERMRIDASGNLGIGMTPSSWQGAARAVQVLSTGSAIPLSIGNSGSTNAGAYAHNAYFNGGWRYAAGVSFQAALYEQNGGQHIWYTSPLGVAPNLVSFTEVMRIDSSGNVGIGGTPTTNLDVAGSGNRTAQVRSTSGNDAILTLLSAGVFSWSWVGGSTLRLIQDASERLRVDASGNVGIGRTPTAQRLEVNLNIAAVGSNVRTVLTAGDDSTLGVVGTTTNHALSIFTNSSERARIDSSGVFTYGGIEVGYRGVPTASVATGAFAASDRGKRVKATGGVTIPNSVMSDGDVVHVLNTTGSAITITKSITTAYNKNTASTLGATFTLAARGSMTVEFTSGTECYVGGNIS